jgi:hypothetical protein
MVNIQINYYNQTNNYKIISIEKSQDNPQEKGSNSQKKNFTYTKQGKSQNLASPNSQKKDLGSKIDIFA